MVVIVNHPSAMVAGLITALRTTAAVEASVDAAALAVLTLKVQRGLLRC